MLIVVGSITTATRLARILEKNIGIPAKVTHTPAVIKSGGCSYSVRINNVSADKVKAVVWDYGINIKGIYTKGRGEREYHDIS